MKTHELKVWPGPFREMVAGRKRAEVRTLKDQPFEVGDELRLRCWDPATQDYTGETVSVRVSDVTDKAGPLDLFGIERPASDQPAAALYSPVWVLSIVLTSAADLSGFLRYIADNYAAIYVRAEHDGRGARMSLAELPPPIAAAWVKTFIERWSVDSSYLPMVVL